MIRKTIILSLILAITVILVPAYAEFASPYQQINGGVTFDMIQCNENKVLMESTSGKPVCVTSKTSEKLLDRGYTMIVPSDEIPFDDNIKPTIQKTITEYNQTKLSSLLTNAYITSKTGEELEIIPNPDGYWTPIVDKKKFAERFLSAVGDEIIDIEDKIDYKGNYISTSYDTRDGFLKIRNTYQITEGPDGPIEYISTDTAYDIPKQAEYINSFMNKMGFKVDGNDVLLSESFIDNCIEMVWNGNICKTLDDDGGGVKIRILPWQKFDTEYQFSKKYSGITFIFYNKAYYTYSDYGIQIKFHGWTNHPELIKTTMDLKNTLDGVIAVQKAYDFALKNDELNKSHRDGGHCEYEPFEIILGEGADKSLIIISGVPYYMLSPGFCTSDPTNTGHFQVPLVLVDAWTGDSIFLTYLGGLD